uniref:hypothetical protein n=1 Tax=Streptomyces lincolnensis TaxID=1915 RepID=UPI0035ABE8EE
MLESALEGELTDHLGHEPGERAAGGRGNYRNRHRAQPVSSRYKTSFQLVSLR